MITAGIVICTIESGKDVVRTLSKIYLDPRTNLAITQDFNMLQVKD
jgi:hypothetical protein